TPDAENAGRGVPNYLSSIAIAPHGDRAWIPAKKDNLRRGLARDGLALDFQSTVRTMIMRLDLASGMEERTLRLDVDDSEIPSAVAFGPMGDPVFIAFQGSNKVLVLNPADNSRLMAIPAV